MGSVGAGLLGRFEKHFVDHLPAGLPDEDPLAASEMHVFRVIRCGVESVRCHAVFLDGFDPDRGGAGEGNAENSGGLCLETGDSWFCNSLI